MTMKDSYLKYIENNIKGILNANNKSDISVSVHDEFYYDKNANADITLKFLPGQIQNKIPQYPAEIFIQVEEEYQSDVIDAFNTFIESYNETVENFGGESYKQFYTLPSILSAFQNGATKRIVTAQVSVSLFSFKNVCGITSITIDNEEIAFVNFAMAFVAETNSTGGLTSQETISTAETITRTLTTTFIPKKDTSNYSATERILEYLLDSNMVDNNPRDYNHAFSITITRQFGESKSWTADWIFKEGSYTQEINGFPTLSLIFSRRA